MNRKLLAALVAATSCALAPAQTPKPFTLQQILSTPYALDLSAAPVGDMFSWIEDAEGSRNIWIGGPHETARKITPYTEDDAQDINGVVWSPDASAVAYAYGAPNGANGKPANPAHLQRDTAVHIIVQPVKPGAKSIDLGEGRAPLFTRDGKSVLFVKSGQIWTADLREGEKSAHRLLFDRARASQLTLSPDGNELAYVSHRGRHSFIGLFDLRTKTLTFLAPGVGYDFAPAFSPDGTKIAWLRGPFTEAPEFAPDRVSADPWSLMVADVAQPGVGRAVFTPEKNKPGSVLPRLSTGDPKVLWLHDGRIGFFSEADKWVHFYAVSVDGGQPELLTPGHGDVEDLSQGPRGNLLWASNICPNYSIDRISAIGEKLLDPCLIDEDQRHIWMRSLDGVVGAITDYAGIETHPVIASDGILAALVSDTTVPMHPALIRYDDGSMTPLHPGAVPKEFPLAAAKHLRPQQVLIPLHPGVKSFLPVDDVRVSLHGQLFLPPGVPATEALPEWVYGGIGMLRMIRSGERDISTSLPEGKTNKRETADLHDEVQSAGPSASLRDDRKKSNGGGTATKKYPVLIFFHGGPMRQMLLGYPSMEYYSNAYAMNQYLASRGFVVLSVNYHCGIGYGSDFYHCVHAGADGASEYDDVLAAQRWLVSAAAKKIVDVDPKRIGLWGGSYGGYLTALGLARNSDLFAAGVDFHGVHEWDIEDNASADWLRGSLADQERLAARSHLSSPMDDVAKWTSPVLLIHGDNDGNVAFNQTPMLADALRAKGVHVETLIFPDEIHEFLLHSDWLKAYEAEAAFFEKELKP